MKLIYTALIVTALIVLALAVFFSLNSCKSNEAKKLSSFECYQAIQSRIQDKIDRINASYINADPKLRERIRIGAQERLVYPNESFCNRCGRPWSAIDSHDTVYEYVPDKGDYGISGKGIFVLGEDCWSELAPEERLPYYRMTVDYWIFLDELLPNSEYYQGKEYYEKKWVLIKEAVLSGG